MKDEKKKSWEEVITSTDLTHNSRMVWQTIRKLSNNPTTPNPPCLVNSDQVAHQLLINGQGAMPTKPSRTNQLLNLTQHIEDSYQRENRRTACHREVSCPPSFSTSTLTTSLSTTEHVVSYTQTICVSQLSNPLS